MMKRFLLFAIICVSLVSCNDDDCLCADWKSGDEVTYEEAYKLIDNDVLEPVIIPDEIMARMAGKSMPDSARVGYSDLRYLRLLHYDIQGSILRGELVT